MGLLDVWAGEVTRVWKGTPREEKIRLAGAFIAPPTFFDAHEALTRLTEPEYEIEDAITHLLEDAERFIAVPYDGWRRNINTPEDVEIVERWLVDR